MPNQIPGRPREAQARNRNDHSRAETEGVARNINALLLKCHARLAVAGLPYIDPAERVPEALPEQTASLGRKPDAHLESAYLWAVLDAEDAAEMAARWRLSQQRARARLYLGHCFRALEQWKEALQCYIDAASVWGVYWGQADIQGLTRLCRWHLSATRLTVRRSPVQSQGFDMQSGLPLGIESPLHAQLPLEEHVSRASTPPEPLALIDGEGDFVGFMLEIPELRRTRRSPDLRGEDWRRRKREEEKHPSAVRAPRVAYRRIVPGASI